MKLRNWVIGITAIATLIALFWYGTMNQVQHRNWINEYGDSVARIVYESIWERGASCAAIASDVRCALPRGFVVDSVICGLAGPAFPATTGLAYRRCIVVQLAAAPILLQDGCHGTVVLGFRVEVFDGRRRVVVARDWSVFEPGDGWDKASTGK